jgi:hypothetical protein
MRGSQRTDPRTQAPHMSVHRLDWEQRFRCAPRPAQDAGPESASSRPRHSDALAAGSPPTASANHSMPRSMPDSVLPGSSKHAIENQDERTDDQPEDLAVVRSPTRRVFTEIRPPWVARYAVGRSGDCHERLIGHAPIPYPWRPQRRARTSRGGALHAARRIATGVLARRSHGAVRRSAGS